MTGRPSLLWLGASIAAHGGLLAALFFVVSGESYSSPLIIDLSALEASTEGESKPAPRSERPAVGVRGSGPKRAGSEQPVERIAAAPIPASPAPVVTPAPAPAPEPVRPPEREVPVSKPEPREPEPALAAAAPREPVPDVAPSVTTSPAAGTNPAATAGSSADGAAGRTATQSSATSGGTSGGSGSRVALAPVGPSGNGGTGGSEYGSYYRQIRQRIQETLEYPAAARRRGITGTVLLELRIKPDGAISAVVKESSSHRVLDDAALETVRNLPRQPFPSGLAPRQLTVPLPVMFDLK